MAAPIIELADEVAEQLAAATGFAFERRVGPYLRREDLEAGRWIVVPAGESTVRKARYVDQATLTVDVAYQRALPDATDGQPDPVENLPWFDAVMADVEIVKSCWRPGGLLRELSLVGFDFSSMANTPIYTPQLLSDYQIFTSVVRLEFTGEIESQ
jgi:hypothetical protein